MFIDIILIAFMAHGDIAVVAAEEDLIALGDDITVRGGVRGLVVALRPQSQMVLISVMESGQFKQPPAAGEQLPPPPCMLRSHLSPSRSCQQS